MAFFTQDQPKDLVESVSNILSQRVAGANLPDVVREAAVEAGKASYGKSLEERRQIMHHYFNSSAATAQVENQGFRPSNATVKDFNEVACDALNQCEGAEGAGSFEDVADDAGSPLSAEDRARLNKRKTNEGAEGAGSFEDVADDEGSPLSAEDRARLNKRKTNEGAESAGSFEDVADDEGSPLTAEDRARLNKRKVKESMFQDAVANLENLDNFGTKKKTFPPDKDGDGKTNEAVLELAQEYLDTWTEEVTDEVLDAAIEMAEEDTSGTDKPAEDAEQDERRVSVKAKTMRDIDDVPVSQTHSFVNESWTMLVDASYLSMGEQHILAGKLVEQDEVTEASACCPTNRQPFTATVEAGSEIEAIENLVSAFENAGSTLGAEEVLVAHRTPMDEVSQRRPGSKGPSAREDRAIRKEVGASKRAQQTLDRSSRVRTTTRQGREVTRKAVEDPRLRLSRGGDNSSGPKHRGAERDRPAERKEVARRLRDRLDTRRKKRAAAK